MRKVTKLDLSKTSTRGPLKVQRARLTDDAGDAVGDIEVTPDAAESDDQAVNLEFDKESGRLIVEDKDDSKQ